MRYRFVGNLYLCCLLAGCATPQASLLVQALPEGQPIPKRLAVDGTLHSGDQFLLQVEVPQAAYVYALRPTREQPERFFPPSGHTLAQPNTPLYIPGPGTYLTLGNGRGRETILVVASVRQLDDDSLRRLVQSRRGVLSRDTSFSEESGEVGDNLHEGAATEANSLSEGVHAAEKKQDPPPPLPTGPVKRPSRQYVVQARLDSTHDAVLQFTFNHAPSGSIARRP